MVFRHWKGWDELGSLWSWLSFGNFSVREAFCFCFSRRILSGPFSELELSSALKVRSPLQTMKSEAAEIPPCFLPFFPSPFSPLLSPRSNHTLPFLRTGELAHCLLACWPQLALYHCKGMHEFSRRYVLSLSVLDTHFHNRSLSPNHCLFTYLAFL